MLSLYKKSQMQEAIRNPDSRLTKAYVEAYPRLESSRAEKLFRAGRAQCQWFDELGEYSGTVWIKGFSERHCSLSYDIISPQASQYGSGEQVISVTRAQTNDLYQKPYFECPSCRVSAALIVLMSDAWACRACHCLAYRSQKLSALQRAQLRHDDIAKCIMHGSQRARPKHMRQERFEALCAELDALKAVLAPHGRQSVHAGLMPMLQPKWI